MGKQIMVAEPKEIRFFKVNRLKVRKVEAGSRHSVFLCEGGKVYVCGFSNNE